VSGFRLSAIPCPAIYEKWIANGPDGLNSIPQPLAGRFHGQYELFFMALTLAMVLLLFGLSSRIARFPLGRVLRAIREDEVVVDAVGKASLQLKVEAFAVGAIFAWIGGAFYGVTP
jgi:branched-chain amino acid transport system permease protein